MLKNQTWSRVSVHRVVLDFIRGEPHYSRPKLPESLHRGVHEPALDSGAENAVRWYAPGPA